MDYTVSHQFDTDLTFNVMTAVDTNGNLICYSLIPMDDTVFEVEYIVSISKMPQQ